ncbi:glycosyltransferase family 61 protein [Coralliovum pocilloporae]|uniref:glycosyltransferase family 61 protein n=1 Tax=Coralliovum pocilloporae TaxID=3066369 RepID=UPI003306F461
MPFVLPGSKKRFNIRYARWVWWRAICRILPALRHKIHFYDRLITPDKVPHEVLSTVEHHYDLCTLGHGMTDAETAFMELAYDHDKATNKITNKRTVRCLRDIQLHGQAGNLIYNAQTVGTDPNLVNYSHCRAFFNPRIIEQPDDRLWLPMLGIHQGHKHFGHFFIDYLAMIFYGIHDLPKDQPITVVTRQDLAPFQRLVYERIKERFPNVSFVEMPTDEFWVLPRVIFVDRQLTIGSIFFDPEYTAFLRDILSPDAEEQQAIDSGAIKLPTGGRYYISRGDVPKRNIANERDLTEALERHGFQTIRPTEYSLTQQAAIYRSADAIVAAAGSAMINLTHVSPETKVRLFYPSNQVGGDFLWLAKSLGIQDHRHIIMGPSEGRRGHYRVDATAINEILEGVD